ncbi:MAG: hypothetical protein RJA99_3153 [Pseudomonadota bacterium]|jgi:hypothetical protein
MASLAPQPKFSASKPDGSALVGGKLFTYATGTTTPLASYIDASGATPNTNPVILDSRGECDLWLAPTQAYRLVLKDANDVQLWSIDDIRGFDPSQLPSTTVNGTLTVTGSSNFGSASFTGSVSVSGSMSVAGSSVLTSATGLANGTPLDSIAGTLSISKGGTGSTSASQALTNLLPSQSGQAGKVLTTNGTVASWGTAGGAPSGSGQVLQRAVAQSVANVAVTSTISSAAALPSSAFGQEIHSVAFTPKASSSLIEFDISWAVASTTSAGTGAVAGTSGTLVLAIFDGGTTAIAATAILAGSSAGYVRARVYAPAGSTTARTYSVRAMTLADLTATTVINYSISGGSLFGGTQKNSVTITETSA